MAVNAASTYAKFSTSCNVHVYPVGGRYYRCSGCSLSALSYSTRHVWDMVAHLIEHERKKNDIVPMKTYKLILRDVMSGDMPFQ